MEALARSLLHIPAPHIPANASDGRKMMGRNMKAGGLATDITRALNLSMNHTTGVQNKNMTSAKLCFVATSANMA